MMSAEPAPAVGKGPKVRICYICGRGFGLNSIDIHEKQCKDLFLAQQEKLPPGERKALPEKPDILASTKGAAGEDAAALLEAQNAAASAVFNDAVMEACPHCGRTFLADRLKVHLRSCTAEKPSRPVGTGRLSETAPAPVSSVRPKTAGGAGSYAAGGGGAAARQRRMLAAHDGTAATEGEGSTASTDATAMAAMAARVTELEKALATVLTEVAALRKTVAALKPPGPETATAAPTPVAASPKTLSPKAAKA